MLAVKELSPDLLPQLERLFALDASANGCWCMWFIIPVREYHAGGPTDNRARFAALAAMSPAPLGLLAFDDEGPVGWCAAGPRARFARAARTPTMKGTDPDENDSVWLVPCFFVRPDARRAGVTKALLEHAVALARKHGAVAIEGFPRAAAGSHGGGDAQVGAEQVFASCGFVPVRRPTAQRVVMRRDLAPA